MWFAFSHNGEGETMSSRFPTSHLRYTLLENKSKQPNHLLSRSLNTHNHTTSHQEDKFISGDGQTCIPFDNNSDPIDSNLFSQLKPHGSVHKAPYILNKIISFCAKSASLYMGIQVHSAIIKMGLDSNVYIGSALVDMYGKCGVLTSAHQLFDEMPHRNVVTWNSLISSCLNTRYSDLAVKLFLEMLRLGITVTPFSVSAVLVGCSQLEAGDLGAQVHGLSLKLGFWCNVVVGTGLIDMYSKCLSIDDSRKVFDQLPDKNVVTWTSMVSGYAQNQHPDEAMVLVREMLLLGLKSNYVAYNSLLSSFRYLDDLYHCNQVHCRIIKEGLQSNSYLAVTLVTLYSECSSSLEDFNKICLGIKIWDQISWNAVIAGFSNLGNGQEALIYFSKMRQEGINVDFFTFTSILRAIGIISASEVGKQTHALVLKTGYDSNVHVQNGLVYMYARCGNLGNAKKVFLRMDERDLISWNSLLSGCANHGYGMDAIELFEQMRETGVKPDLTTFLAVLSACSHVGLLEKGLEYFDFMRYNKFLPPPKVEHYACIVDLYGRAGYLQEAEAFINRMPIDPGLSVFKSLISACQVHGDTEIANRCARKLVELFPNDPATYVLLSNVLATGGYWSDAAGVRKLMYYRGVKKKPGSSWV